MAGEGPAAAFDVVDSVVRARRTLAEVSVPNSLERMPLLAEMSEALKQLDAALAAFGVHAHSIDEDVAA